MYSLEWDQMGFLFPTVFSSWSTECRSYESSQIVSNMFLLTWNEGEGMTSIVFKTWRYISYWNTFAISLYKSFSVSNSITQPNGMTLHISETHLKKKKAIILLLLWWLRGGQCFPLNLMTWVWSPGPTGWKEKNYFHKLFTNMCDAYVCMYTNKHTH